MRVRFLSSNERKIAETRAILDGTSVEVIPVLRHLHEIQDPDLDHLVREKCVQAFRLIGRPVFVEHTGLYIEALNGFPGGLTRIFWETLGPERVATLFGGEDKRATARTRIGYCDGCAIRQFEGEVAGTIAPEPRGAAEGEWDSVFIPDGGTETFAEMGERKNTLSMRRAALEAFVAHLEGGSP
ncbi:MAG TPA: non-canonical purine NTP pyrophosphatase [Beijerinckiaceae bacterium]|jgi:XTP/dITP diphosphohydrolase